MNNQELQKQIIYNKSSINQNKQPHIAISRSYYLQIQEPSGHLLTVMYQTSCNPGVCAEVDQVDPLISQEPSSLPTELDYSGFDIVKATQYGALSRVRELVDSGWNVNQPDSETVTLLHWASINNRRDIISYLLDRGAIVDAVGGELNATPLHWATRQGHLGACVQLMQAGADPSLR